jgi:hypothetical protein
MYTIVVASGQIQPLVGRKMVCNEPTSAWHGVKTTTSSQNGDGSRTKQSHRLLLPCGIIDCTGFWRSITQHKTQQGVRFVRFTSLRARGEAYREGEREGLVTEPAHSQHPVLFSSCNISHNCWRDFRAKSAGLNHQQQTRTTIEMLTKAWLVRSCHKHNNTRNKSLLPKVVSLFLASICFPPFLPFFMWPPITCAETFGTPERIWQEVGKQERTAGFHLQALSIRALQTNQAEITNEAFLHDDDLQDWIGRQEKMRGGKDLTHTHTHTHTHTKAGKIVTFF